MPQIEIAVVGIIIALAVFLVGGNLLQNFAVFTMLGSVIALLVTLVGLRLVLGLLLHEPSLNQRLDWIGINSKRIPNLAKDQKQTYFGLFSNTDFSAKKIWVTLGSLLLAGTFVVASVTFTVLEQPLFTPVATTIQSRLYIEVADGAVHDRGDSLGGDGLIRMVEAEDVAELVDEDTAQIEGGAAVPAVGTPTLGGVHEHVGLGFPNCRGRKRDRERAVVEWIAVNGG